MVQTSEEFQNIHQISSSKRGDHSSVSDLTLPNVLLSILKVGDPEVVECYIELGACLGGEGGSGGMIAECPPIRYFVIQDLLTNASRNLYSLSVSSSTGTCRTRVNQNQLLKGPPQIRSDTARVRPPH